MILPSTNHALRVRLDAIPSAELPCVVGYADLTSTTLDAGAQTAFTNGTSDVEILSAPAASTKRQIKNISVVNISDAPTTLTISVYDGSNEYAVFVGLLYPNYTASYTADKGWSTSPPFVPVNSVNGQDGDVVLDYTDVGAAAAVHSHVLSDISDAGTMAAESAGDYTPTSGLGDLAFEDGLTYTDVGAAAASHTHPSSDITDFTEAAQDAVGSALASSTEISLSYNDGSNSISAELNLNSVAWDRLNQTAGYSVLGRQTSGSGDVTYITSSANAQILMRTSNVVGFKPWDNDLIGDGVLPYAKMVDIGGFTVLARTTSGTGPMNGLAATSNDTFLRRTGDSLNFGGLTDGMVATNTLSLSKLKNASAQYNLIGRTSASAGEWEQKATSASVFTMLGSADNAEIRSNIGISAANTPNTPAGNIVSTDVQSALNELDTEKVAKVGDTMTGKLNIDIPTGTFFGLRLTENSAGNVGAFFETMHDSASPAAGDQMGGWNFNARNSSAAEITYAQMLARLIDANAGTEDAEFLLRGIVGGTLPSTANATLAVGNGVKLAAATGGYQGSGTLNGTAIYDDGVLLTCPAFHPDLTLDDWNALTPNRRHAPRVKEHLESTGKLNEKGEPILRLVSEVIRPGYLETAKHRTAKRHFDMIAEGFDANNPLNYVARMRADKAVPGALTLEEWTRRMPQNGDGTLSDGADKPSIGEYMTRLQLQLDYMAQALAAAIEELERLKRK